MKEKAYPETVVCLYCDKTIKVEHSAEVEITYNDRVCGTSYLCVHCFKIKLKVGEE